MSTAMNGPLKNKIRFQHLRLTVRNMALAGAVAAGWIPFIVLIVLILLFSTFYVRYLQSRYESDWGVLTIAVLSLTFTLATCCLLPTDVFLVSYTKFKNGTFKPWANSNVIDHFEKDVMITYYFLYSVIAVLAFLVLPLAYFYHEAKDDDQPSRKLRLCSAFKYTSVFLVVAVVLLVLGAVLPMEFGRSFNGTSWERVEDLLNDMGRNRGTDAIGYMILILSLLGMLVVMVYTAYGMSAWPIMMLKGRRDPVQELEQVQAEQQTRQQQRQRSTNPFESSSHVEVADNALDRQQRALQDHTQRRWYLLCCRIARPFEIMCGILLLAFGLLVFISLLLSSIDKAMNSLGAHAGYVLQRHTLPNPIDLVLVGGEKVFPLNLIIFAFIVLFLLFSTMNGMRLIGIRVLWIKLYKIRPHRTRPQGVLFLCLLLILTVLALNTLMFLLTPVYSTFGSQKYWNDTQVIVNGTHIMELIPCDVRGIPKDCTMSRLALFLNQYFLKAWYIGAVYYWLTWLFLGVFLVGGVVAVAMRPPPTVEIDADELEEEDARAIIS